MQTQKRRGRGQGAFEYKHFFVTRSARLRLQQKPALKRGQGAFEYILLLAGILLVVIIAVVLLKGGVLSGAQSGLSSTATKFGQEVSSNINSPVTLVSTEFTPLSTMLACIGQPIIFYNNINREQAVTITREVGSEQVYFKRIPALTSAETTLYVAGNYSYFYGTNSNNNATITILDCSKSLGVEGGSSGYVSGTASPTATEEPTASPTSSPTPTPTAIPTATPSPGEILYAYDLLSASNSSMWQYGVLGDASYAYTSAPSLSDSLTAANSSRWDYSFNFSQCPDDCSTSDFDYSFASGLRINGSATDVGKPIGIAVLLNDSRFPYYDFSRSFSFAVDLNLSNTSDSFVSGAVALAGLFLGEEGFGCDVGFDDEGGYLLFSIGVEFASEPLETGVGRLSASFDVDSQQFTCSFAGHSISQSLAGQTSGDMYLVPALWAVVVPWDESEVYEGDGEVDATFGNVTASISAGQLRVTGMRAPGAETDVLGMFFLQSPLDEANFSEPFNASVHTFLVNHSSSLSPDNFSFSGLMAGQGGGGFLECILLNYANGAYQLAAVASTGGEPTMQFIDAEGPAGTINLFWTPETTTLSCTMQEGTASVSVPEFDLNSTVGIGLIAGLPVNPQNFGSFESYLRNFETAFVPV